MRISFCLAAVGLVAIATGLAHAQQPVPGGGQLPATTVQLPSFSFFTVNTTVSVPDRGGMYMGGVNRARDGRIERGLGNRGIGGDRLASGMSVHATIIDRDELDAAVLAAAAKRQTAIDPKVLKAEQLTRAVGRGGEPVATAAAPGRADLPGSAILRESAVLPDSVAGIRASKATDAEARTTEAAGLLAQAEAAEAEGKLAFAKIYYQMVVRRDAGQLKQLATARLAAISKKSGSVAKR